MLNISTLTFRFSLFPLNDYICHPMPLLFLILFAFLAGFIDSVAGGGGLIQLPAFFIFFPGLHGATVLGTNKFAAFAGTSVAAWRYVKNTPIQWKAILPAIITALVFSFLGARIVSLLNRELLKPIMLGLLVAVAGYTFLKKNFGMHHLPRLNHVKTIFYSLLTGAALGFYDGFFVPGTGSFLIVIFISLFGFNFLIASASAKVVNCATNFAALAYFIYSGNIRYDIAIPVAISNMAGSYIGSHLAIKKGSVFVRTLFLVVVSGMILKFAYDIFYG